MTVRDKDGRVFLNSFQGAVEGSKGSWDHSCSENGRTF
jgi:hypothetical protein